ncbi:MAG: winged helix-turn-helix domain-containing tetratricopeptide repeat protein [Roseovarius sp.]|nr:winged helix-turn-helix domain-containing tetratricopeptide repeat protein [Roseovarius sp.]
MLYRFGTFVLDRERGLFENGEVVDLEPKSLELLAYLLEHRDRVVGRDELIDHLWQGRVVSDAALSTQVRSVRRALGDDRTRQAYIRTLPKRGFRFVTAVEAVETPDGPEGPENMIPAEGGMARGRRGVARLAPLLVAVGIIAGALGWWLLPRAQHEADAPRLSIAVLPFDNLSGDATQDYLADAFTEDLITDLSRIRDAFVIARRTSFTYKNRNVDVAQVAGELDVRYVLEGSLRRTGDNLRINAQLIDGKTNRHIWSQRFERNLTEVFSGQYEVTGQIASALKAELREADLARQGPPDSLKAWDHALKGNVELVQPDRDFHAAQDHLRKAISLDPGIASAWSGLAFVHFAASFGNVPGVSVPESKALSLEYAKRAVALDPKNAEGHWMVGVGYARNGQTERARAACDEAMALNPNNDCGYVCAGLTRMAAGEPEAAIPFFEHSLRLNPRFRTFTKHKFMGIAHVQAGNDAEAIRVLNKSLAQAPDDALSHLTLSAALAHRDRLPEARDALDRFRALAPDSATRADTLQEAYGWMGPGFDRVLVGAKRAGLR